jgi:tRNA threonylcarbamoyladenosine biosynthesis protein TsaE
MVFFLKDSAATECFGADLWAALPPQCLVFLQGDLGMGKTTLVRGFLRAAGFSGPVKSPTYTLVEEYALGLRRIVHFDLYRLLDPEELEWMGIRDYFTQESMCFIEWPEQGKSLLPPPDLVLQFQAKQAGRALEVDIVNRALKNILSDVIKQRDTGIL